MSYATTTQLRTAPYLTQVATGNGNDSALQLVLDRADAIINDYLGFSFAAYGATASDRDVRGQGGEWLWPTAYKAGSITGITFVTARGDTEEAEEAITDYEVDEELRPYRIWRAGGWIRQGWYRVTAIWGYGAAPVSVVEVALEIAVNIWRSGAASSFGNSVGVEGGGAVQVNRALTWAQRNILEGVRAAYLGVVHA